jgi:uncharacterized membrane protein
MMGTGSGYGSGWYGTMMGSYGGWLFPLLGLLVLVAIVVLVVWAIRKRS